MRFTKMHGLGNDYVYVNCFEETIDNLANLARRISDRHFGVGSDGLILICPSKIANVRMRIFNADGSEAQMCGNGIRCVAKYTYEHKLAQAGGEFSVPSAGSFPASLTVETGNGVLTLGLGIGKNDKVEKVCVNMGQPKLNPKDIPVNLEGEKIIDREIEVLVQRLNMTCVSMGNPHAVFFCDNVKAIELERFGPAIENHTLFPERTNVHFVQPDGNNLIMRTWERGSGITLACGTGACAVAVAAVLNAVGSRNIIVQLPGGNLQITWASEDNCVYMTGPAESVFQGTWPE
ncbi:MAG: diaminopimelate epimerase [Phycisphaerae bacterium]